LREAFSAGIITNEELWFSMLKDRNPTVHIYSEQIVKKICLNIEEIYAEELNSLLIEIQQRKFES